MGVVDYLNAARFRFNRYPSHVILFVTGRCNARCNHCFYWKEIKKAKKEQELTLDEIRKISENFGHIKLLSITGGDPSLRDDVPEIVHTFYENNGVTNVVFTTNGFLTEEIADIATRIVSENPLLQLNLRVSIDSLGEMHDLIRGVKGAFEKAERTLERVAREKQNFPNLTVSIITCFTYFNQDKLKEMIDYFFEDSKIDIDSIYVDLVRGDSADERVKNVDIDKYRELVSYLDEKSAVRKSSQNYPLASFLRAIYSLTPKIVIATLKKKKMIYPCKAGQSVIVISETGDVLPCEMLNKKFGNLREHNYDIGELLFSKDGTALRSFVKHCGCYCTWECAIMNNLIFNWRASPRLLSTWLQLELKKVFGK